MTKGLRELLGMRNPGLRDDALLERDEDYWDVIQPARQEDIQRAQATERTTIECPRCGGSGRLGTFTTTKDW